MPETVPWVREVSGGGGWGRLPAVCEARPVSPPGSALRGELEMTMECWLLSCGFIFLCISTVVSTMSSSSPSSRVSFCRIHRSLCEPPAACPGTRAGSAASFPDAKSTTLLRMPVAKR